jgi:hypothetical protein
MILYCVLIVGGLLAGAEVLNSEVIIKTGEFCFETWSSHISHDKELSLLGCYVMSAGKYGSMCVFRHPQDQKVHNVILIWTSARHACV